MKQLLFGDIFFGAYFFGLALLMFWYWKKTSYDNKYLLLAFILNVFAFLINVFDLFTNIFLASNDLRLISDKVANTSLPIIAIISLLGLLLVSKKTKDK